MKSLLDNIKNHWKNYLIGLLLVLIFFGGYFNPLSISSSSYMTQGFDSVNQRFAAESSYFPGHYGSNNAPSVEDRKVTKDANMNLESYEYYESKDKIMSAIESYEGLILSETESENTNRNTMTLSLNVLVDSKSLEVIVEDLKSYAEVKSVNIYTNDVTGSYINYESRLDRYTDQVQKYENMLDRDNLEVSEEIEITQRIDNLENQIYYIEQNQERLLEDISYSNLYISLSEKPNILEETDFLGLRDSVSMFLSALNNGLSFLIKALGFLIPFGVVFLVYKLARRFRK